MYGTTALYANDEDIALRASADFSILCPRDQKLAWGTDGVFLQADPWTLTSQTVNFETNGLLPGNVVYLLRPVANFKPPGEAFVVSSITPGAVTLRRKGQQVGTGQPPGASIGLTGVEFLIVTFAPQIALASYDLNRRYGIDDLIAGRRTCDLYDPREVREATVLTVLYQQYLVMSRGSEDRLDTFATKSRLIKAELDDLLARVILHWKPSSTVSSTDTITSRMSTRLTR